MATLSGFYAVSKTVPNTITFFSQTPIPPQIQSGWVITGLPGIQGQAMVTSMQPVRGSYPGYGAFTGTINFQVNVPQTIQGVQPAPAVQVAAAPVIAPPVPPSLTGSYFTQTGLFIIYSSEPLPKQVAQGWNIKNFPGAAPNTLNVTSVSFQSGNLGRINYSGIITAVPLPPPPPAVPPDPSALAKLLSVLNKAGAFAEILGGKILGLRAETFRDPVKLSKYLESTPNLLSFISKKSGLEPESILADPTQIKDTLKVLPELTNALGFRLRGGPNKLVDGFLNDKIMLTALGSGPVLTPVLPSTDAYPGGVALKKQGALVDPNSNDAFVPAIISTTEPIVRAPIEDVNFQRFPVGLRELGHDISVPHEVPEPLIEKRNLGFNAGGVLSLDAIGPQEEYLSNVSSFSESQWEPGYEHHTNSVLYQDYIQMTPISSTTFVQPNTSGTCVVTIEPKNQGDLIGNMFLQCTLPALPTGYSYTNQIGRAIIQQIDFMVDDQIIETIYDDWLFIRDQVFLDYDEQIGMFNQVNGGQANTNLSPTSPVSLVIPLEFFFCRRHSYANKGRERLRRPFFPMCSLWGGQKIYIKFTFRPQYWFTNYTGNIDIQNPVLLVEYVKMTNKERLYYRNAPLRYIVPLVKKESTAPYASGSVSVNLTANFPVQLLAWFIRNQTYESTDPSYYDSRYLYGYATQYIQAAVQLSFPSGAAQYLDVIQSVKITVNNQDILDTFANGPYTSFLQPMQHGLSVPQKNIYMYSFALNVTEYNSGGYLNFSKINSQTSNLTLTFLPQYATSLTGYNLYLFYYGFSILEFKNGFAGVSYL
jgi:hypothetical protein